MYTSDTNTEPAASAFTWTKFVGDSAKNITLSANSQVFKMSGGNATPEKITVTGKATNTSITTWEYSVDGKDFNPLPVGSTTISGVSRTDNATVSITGSSLSSNYLILRASDGSYSDVFTVYKAFDGATGSPGAPGTPASMAFLTNENVTFSANANGKITATSITTNVVAYNGPEKVTPTIGSIGNLPDGITATIGTVANKEVPVIFTVAGDATLGSVSSNNGSIAIPVTSPVDTNLILSWSKVNAGQQGPQGNNGNDAYTVMLTNEAHIFAGDVNYAYADSVTTQILGYKGSTEKPVTIKFVGGKAAAIIDTNTDITGLKFKCSAPNVAPQTITFTCTEDFTSASGSIPIVISVDGIEFTRMFNYSIAFKGAAGNTGAQGLKGDAATSYWLVSSASAIQKTSTGTITVTPSTLTFAGKSKTGTNAPVDYACRWIIEYSTDGTKYTNLYTSTENTASKTITVQPTYKTIRARMYMAGGTTALLDEQIIPVVSDGAKGDKGDQGIQGIQGPKGEQGIQGPQGADGKSSYFHIKYSANANGNPMTETPSTYIGTYVDYTEADSADYTKYTWSRFIGSQGEKGDQGIAGNNGVDGKTSYLHIAYATSANGSSGFSVSDSVGKTYIGQYTDYTQADSTDYTKYKWTLIKGEKGDAGRGVSKITEYYLATTASSGVTTTTSGWTEAVQTIDITKKYLWNYELIAYTDNTTSTTTPVIIGVFGNTGATGKGISSVAERYLATTLSSGVTTSTSGWTPEIQTLTSTKKYLWNYEIITYTDGTTSTVAPVVIGVYGDKGDKGDTGNTGRGVSSIKEQYYQSTSATTQTEGTWADTVPTWADGKYIWTRSVVTYTDSTTSTTSPVCVTGQKGGTGGTGVGVSSVDVWYYQSTSATSLSGGSWSTTAPTWSDGKYVWTKTIVTYTNNTTDETAAVCITGQKGSTGVGIKSVTEYYLATSSSSGVTTSTTGWTTAIQTITVDKKYLWNYEIITYTDNTTNTTTPIIIGAFGSTGNGIKSVTEYYLATTASSGVTTATTGWTTTMQALTATNKYLWNYELITYTDNTTATINPIIIGVYGDRGNQGVGISSVTVTYGVSTSASTQPTSWQTTLPTVAEDSYLWTRTVTDYTDASVADTVTYTYAKQGAKGGIGSSGTSVTVSSIQYQAGTSATTAPTGTWSNSVVAVSEGGYLWTKTTFSDGKVAYGVAKQGVSGRGISSVVEYYLASTSSTGVTTTTSGWTTTIQSIDSTKRYLWNYELITYTDSTTSTTTPVVIGAFGNTGLTGATGKGIKSVTEYYLATSSSSNVTTSTSGWTTAIQSLTSTKKYLWNYEIITYTDDTTATINPVIIGVYGDKGVDAVTFQLYAPNGYLLMKDLSEITLQTLAYDGSAAITSGATYQWAQYIEDEWENISGATTQVISVNKNDVIKSKSYKCTMTYKSKQYIATATVQDKTDIYESLIQVTTKYSPANKLYWVLYSTVYSEEGERDELLGSIGATAPTNPTTGQYWYKIDETNYTVTLMKYSGTAWATTTDKQELVYDWSLINDTDKPISLGTQSKVKIITSSDFSKTCSVQCNIRGSESIPISYSNQILIDPSDPIVASVEPTNPAHGQLWIKTGTNGLYTLLVWDASIEQWIVSETDSRVKVHMSKPSSYEIGDVWVVGGDYEPTIYINGVAQTTKHLSGTMLKAQYSSQSYKDADWIEALNYKNEIDDLKENLNTYNQFFSFDEDGLTMQAKNKSGVISEFKTKLTNTELGFYQGENKVAHINNNQLNISKAEITNGMTISGSAPILEIGNFTIMQESNGSLSIGLKS